LGCSSTYSKNKPHSSIINNMPEEIALLPHLQWAKNYINAIYTADSYEAATLMLDSFLSKKATVVINGVETSRSDAINRMNGHLQPQRGVLVNFIDTIDSQEDSNLGDWVTIPFLCSRSP